MTASGSTSRSTGLRTAIASVSSPAMPAISGARRITASPATAAFLVSRPPTPSPRRLRVRAISPHSTIRPASWCGSTAQHWVKAGIELSDGRAMLSSVLTHEQSDWTTAPYAHDAGDFRLRATVSDGVLRLQVSTDGKLWPLIAARAASRRSNPIWWGRWPARPSGPDSRSAFSAFQPDATARQGSARSQLRIRSRSPSRLTDC